MRSGLKRRRRLSALGMFVLVIVGSLVLTMALRAVHTVAQDGLPTPEGRLGGAVSIATQAPAVRTPTPSVRRVDIPSPNDCDTEPRTIDEILGLVSTPRPTATPGGQTAATERAPSSTAATPSDRPATAAIVGQIQRSVRALTACGNAGELLSVWAFFTDKYVSESASQGGVLFNRTILTARVQAAVDRKDAMPTVSNVRSHADGRITAQVTVPIGSPFSVITGQTGVVTCGWVEVSGAWRIDQVSSGDGTGGP